METHVGKTHLLFFYSERLCDYFQDQSSCSVGTGENKVSKGQYDSPFETGAVISTSES